MIKANELRLGNWVNYDEPYNGKPNYQQLGFEYFIMIGNGKTFAISPITLTPEILEKCGFERLVYEDFPEDQLYQYGDGFILNYTADGWNLSDHSITKMMKFKFVHQLQNLYFALTWEELTINL